MIITAASDQGMVDIHDRKPLVLAPDLAREWLDQATSKERAEEIAIQQCESAGAFEWFEVGKEVGNVRNQGQDLISPG